MCKVPRSSVERPRSLDEHRSERMASAEFRGPQYDLGWTSRPRRSPVNVSATKCRPVDTFGAGCLEVALSRGVSQVWLEVVLRFMQSLGGAGLVDLEC